MHRFRAVSVLLLPLLLLGARRPPVQDDAPPERPNVILVMADDQGYGDVGYMGHPHLKTPVLDEMAASGLTFTRFYAAAPVCTPTRGSVLTGRHPNRFGAFQWGHTLRPQERTLAEVLRQAGYRTGHFGKWHLGPMIAGEPASPGESGFDRWVSAFNFYDNDPWFSDNGQVRHVHGESSMVTVRVALQFIEDAAEAPSPFLAVVWFGNPHRPHEAVDSLQAVYPSLSDRQQNYLGEITGIDRAMGRLRRQLREMGIAEQTVLWYTSDNGGDKPVANNGNLRGYKGSLWEGGLRVPAIIEWPGHLSDRSTDIRATTSDIYPTVLDLADVEMSGQPRPLDGISLVPVLNGEKTRRKEPIGFWDYPMSGRPVPNDEFMTALYEEQQAGEPTVRVPPLHPPGKTYSKAKKRAGWAAWIDGNWKLHRRPSGTYELYNLAKDPTEEHNRIDEAPKRAAQMKKALKKWQRSVTRSLNGADYQ